VAEAVDMSAFPGTEYASNAAAPSAARIQQITQEQCQPAVKSYLGIKYDPNSRFGVGMMWPGTKAWSAGERRMLCGLQLPGPGKQPQAVKGRVADVDQSKVWAAGTCIGIETAINEPTDVPVDCVAPHAMEVTGTVNLADKFPDALPPEADRDGFVNDACTKMTDAYLAPAQLRATTLTLTHGPMTLQSWSAGSRQVACFVGATLGTGGWSTLVGSAKGPQLLINGQPPVAPPNIPLERLNVPSIPLPTAPTTIDASGSPFPEGTLSGTAPTGNLPTGTQHLPNAPGPQTVPVDPNAPAPGQQGQPGQPGQQGQHTQPGDAPGPAGQPAPDATQGGAPAPQGGAPAPPAEPAPQAPAAPPPADQPPPPGA
jgi:predicted heme/steroid binding protein